MRLYLTTAKVLRVLLDDPVAPRYGLDLMRETGIASGTLFPILRRLEAEGLVTAEREQIDPRVQERPARIYYRLTAYGTEFARTELNVLADQLRPPAGDFPEWELAGWELAGWAGVDSGRLMIADPCYTADLPREFLDSDCLEARGVDGWMPHGQSIAVMVLTQGGDGLFPVRVQRDEAGRITAVRADFTHEASAAAHQEADA